MHRLAQGLMDVSPIHASHLIHLLLSKADVVTSCVWVCTSGEAPACTLPTVDASNSTRNHRIPVRGNRVGGFPALTAGHASGSFARPILFTYSLWSHPITIGTAGYGPIVSTENKHSASCRMSCSNERVHPGAKQLCKRSD